MIVYLVLGAVFGAATALFWAELISDYRHAKRGGKARFFDQRGAIDD